MLTDLFDQGNSQKLGPFLNQSHPQTAKYPELFAHFYYINDKGTRKSDGYFGLDESERRS
jgi:hypothetical protein